MATMLYGLTLLLVPFGIALLFAFILNPPINFLERLGMPRWLAVLIVLPLFVLSIVGISLLVYPAIAAEVGNIQGQADVYRARAIKVFGAFLWNLEEMLRPYFLLTDTNLAKMIQNFTKSFKSIPGDALAALPTILTYLLITPIIMFIFLLQGNDIYRNLLSMVPNRYFEMTLLLVIKIKERITSYLKGLLVQMAILTVILSVGFYIIGLPFGVFLGFLAALLNIVPYFGPLMGLVPALLVAVITPASASLIPMTLMVFGIAQLVDNIFTQPVILAKSVQIHPLVSVLALIAAGQILGMFGLLIAIPLAGIIMVSIQVMYASLKAFKVI